MFVEGADFCGRDKLGIAIAAQQEVLNLLAESDEVNVFYQMARARETDCGDHQVATVILEALREKQARENPEPLTKTQVMAHIASDPHNAEPLWVEAPARFFGSSGWLYTNESEADHPVTGEMIPIASVEWLMKENGDMHGIGFRFWRCKPTKEQMEQKPWRPLTRCREETNVRKPGGMIDGD